MARRHLVRTGRGVGETPHATRKSEDGYRRSDATEPGHLDGGGDGAGERAGGEEDRELDRITPPGRASRTEMAQNGEKTGKTWPRRNSRGFWKGERATWEVEDERAKVTGAEWES